jgi:hypothetical protein
MTPESTAKVDTRPPWKRPVLVGPKAEEIITALGEESRRKDPPREHPLPSWIHPKTS